MKTSLKGQFPGMSSPIVKLRRRANDVVNAEKQYESLRDEVIPIGTRVKFFIGKLWAEGTVATFSYPGFDVCVTPDSKYLPVLQDSFWFSKQYGHYTTSLTNVVVTEAEFHWELQSRNSVKE